MKRRTYWMLLIVTTFLPYAILNAQAALGMRESDGRAMMGVAILGTLLALVVTAVGTIIRIVGAGNPGQRNLLILSVFALLIPPVLLLLATQLNLIKLTLLTRLPFTTVLVASLLSICVVLAASLPDKVDSMKRMGIKSLVGVLIGCLCSTWLAIMFFSF